MQDKSNMTFDFGEALKLLKAGKSVARRGWNGKGIYISQQTPDENSKMTRAYLYITTPKGTISAYGVETPSDARVPWLASQTDLLLEDWFEVVLPEDKPSEE